MRFFYSHVLVISATLLAITSRVLADPKIDEQLVGPPGRTAYVLSQRGVHVAAVAASGSRFAVTIDGVAGPVVDQLLTPAGQPFGGANSVGVSEVGDVGLPVLFSPDGDHYAYAARMGEEAIIFWDGKEIARGPMNASVLNFGPLCMSPGGKHLFFTLTSTAGGVKRQFYFDGKPVALLPQDTPPVLAFSPDDSHYWYYSLSEDRKQSILIVDGKDAGYLGIEPRFTADNKLVSKSQNSTLLIDGKPANYGESIQKVFIPKVGNKIITINTRPNPGGQLYFLVVDGKPVPESECLNNITKIVFSPDGNRYMARCVGQGNMWMIVDGKKSQNYNGIGDDFSFSADSTKYAYLASNATSNFFVVDGKETEVGVMGAKPIFSAKGSRLAYVTGENRLKMHATVDDKSLPMSNDIMGVVFSPDGSRYAYQYNTMSSASLNVDGEEQKGLIAGSFIFSPDSKHVLITGQRVADRQNGLYLDGQLVYKQVGRFTRQIFSADGKHVYWATVETGQPVQLAVYLDGKVIQKFDANANNVFETMPESWDVSADGVLTFLAITPEGMKKLRVTPGESTVETMAADFKTAEEKAIADAAKAKADAEAAKAKAAADAQKAREDAAAARLKAQQDAAAARAKAAQDAAAARAARRGAPANSGR